MIVAHLAVSIAFSGNENEASVFGIGIEGPGAQWINAIKFNLVSRFFELWAFVAVGGVVAPGFPVPAIVLAVLMVSLHLTAPHSILSEVTLPQHECRVVTYCNGHHRCYRRYCCGVALSLKGLVRFRR